jgi:translocation protein SEC63
MDPETKTVNKSMKALAKNLNEYLRLPDAEKKNLAKLTPAQREEVLATCKIFPKLNIKVELLVEEEEKDFYDDEPDGNKPPAENDTEDNITITPSGHSIIIAEKIYEQDLVTVRISLTRENVPEGQEAPPVLAPFFPRTLHEGWWFILTDKPGKSDNRRSGAEAGIHAVEKIVDRSRVVTHELRFMAPQKVGTYSMDLHIYCDCYLGLDETIEINFNVNSALELPEYQPHPEDLELDNEPTLFEQVMAANLDDSSDDEDEKKDPKINKTSNGNDVAVDDDEEEDEAED